MGAMSRFSVQAGGAVRMRPCILHVHIFVAEVIKWYDTVDRGILDYVLSQVGVAWMVSACLF